jgi:molybdate transport system regulatory protein
VALYRDLRRSQQALVERAAADAEGGTPSVEPAAREHTAAGAGAAVPPRQPDRAQPGPAGALPRPALLTSARNQFVGRVASLSDIGGMVRIRVDLEGDPPIDAVVTPESVATMALAPGCEVMALVKAPWVTLCASAPRRRAGVNVLPGTIATLHRGGSVTRLTLTTAGRRIVSAAMPSDAGVLARLQRGSAAWARFAADAVLLATVA